eukprot:TRINITY_DN6486_c0_g1_i2.p1 TRINITY_DN6486_c0_g1~~TRINITY_DN6486_c0_g1_i2.p1  ORF type:complete len:1064 (+),score=153.97 TRINITY_DN6486_c0_g1_i2:230-3421(+)
MGQTESAPAQTGPSDQEKVMAMTSIEFISALKSACGENDLVRFGELWQYIEQKRAALHPNFDAELINENKDSCIRHLKFAFRHTNTSWREMGVRICKTFFHLREAREKFVNLNFTSSMMFLTMPEQGDEDNSDDVDGAGKEASAKQEEFQLLVAETLLQMADYEEFAEELCSTSVLNFLCIALNQTPAAVEIATSTFVKISSYPENLALFLSGSVGDILDSFFKSTPYKRPHHEEECVQWAKDISALSSCAHTMGTMIRYGYVCKVDRVTVGAMFVSKPNSLRLVAELVRLFYWMCRTSDDLFETIKETAPGHSGESLEGVDTFLFLLVQLWDKSVTLQRKLQNRNDLEDFLIDDIDPSRKIELDSEEFKDKQAYAEMCLCYLNCLWWLLLPHRQVCWRLRNFELKDLHCAFELREQNLLQVCLGTVRHLLDLAEVQECHELVSFFAEQLLNFVDMALQEKSTFPDKQIPLLLEGLSILSLQRGMQSMLAEFSIRDKLASLVHAWHKRNRTVQPWRVQLSVLRILSQVAVHPSHRLGWVAMSNDPAEVYPPRAEFEQELEALVTGRYQESFKTIASLLLTMFQERKFQKEITDVETTFHSILDWWYANTSARYEEEKLAGEEPPSGGAGDAQATAAGRHTQPLKQKFAICIQRIAENRHLGSIEALDYCAPYECVLALSLFSRLALEPKFKRLMLEHALEPLLGCVCTGIWAEAREAAATLANLMWMPDLDRDHLVCWLKFDGSATVDAANVLLPIKAGEPRRVKIGKGMYRSTWGMEFVKNSCITLHPDGFKSYSVPSLLTTASPTDTFKVTSQSPYHWLDEPPHPRHFTVTCWFYWPLNTDANSQDPSVLLQSSAPERLTQIYVSYETEEDKQTVKAVWTLVDHTRTERALKTPPLSPGWHLLALVSSTNRCTAQPFNGTKFFLDDFGVKLENVWVLNDFFMVGNDISGKKPFGLIADFRIYARSLSTEEIQKMVQADCTDDHPDQIARRLGDMDAAKILAQRLDVPDSAAESLRALGSLATLATQRANILNVCGREALRLLDSPLPMIHRQAARLMNNLA